MSPSPSSIPLPPSPSPSSPLPSPLTQSSHPILSPMFNRDQTSATVRKVSLPTGPIDPFHDGTKVSFNQPVGSLSISPSSRDVCLASRKGLYILNLANLNQAPRFIPQGGTWQIADCQWSPHPPTSNLILSTSSQKLLVWDLLAAKPLLRSIDAHARAITDINWHARNPNLMATVSMDAGIRGWDLRMGDTPFMRLCAWGMAGTQVKWNRQHEHVLATAHGKEVYVWDNRKGSVAVTVIKAHDAKIYGIDWDRRHRHKLVTCSLDKTIKFWTIPELQSGLGEESVVDALPSLPAPGVPDKVISTMYPVWRARNLPFGCGVLALPQRSEKGLQMYNMDKDVPVETFEGHDDVVKEFVWRTRGGDDESFDDREFQLVTWSKDRTLRTWPVDQETMKQVGYCHGEPIKVLVSRRGAPDITYSKPTQSEERRFLPAPLTAVPSGISRQKMAKVDVGMTRGGGKMRKGMDQLDWLTKVVKNTLSPDSSGLPSRMGSMSRAVSTSRPSSTEGIRDPQGDSQGDFISLKDEVVLVSKSFPRPKINFEKIDLHHRKLTMSMNGPWANGDRMAFIRIHWSFPALYPYSADSPTFELERNPTVSPITRKQLITTLKDLRSRSHQCLMATSGFLLGLHEWQARGRIDESSDSETEIDIKLSNVPMLMRTSGATFGPNGQLVCFFPKQTILPRARGESRSPSSSRDAYNTPLAKAMAALSRLENPRQRKALPKAPRIRRIETTPTTAQAGSTLTIHDVSHLGNPDARLAKLYSASLDSNLYHAMEAKRFNHVQVWATLKGLLNDPPPPYSVHPPLQGMRDPRTERETWERSVIRKNLILHQLFTTLIAERDVQILALVAVILLGHVNASAEPPESGPPPHHSPEKDYFALPRNPSLGPVTPMTIAPTPGAHTPMRNRSLTPISPGAASRTSGWSQILTSSSLSLRPSIGTPRDRRSFDVPRPSLATSVEDQFPTASGFPIPVPPSKKESPRRERPRDPKVYPPSPPTMTPLKSVGTDISSGSSHDRPHTHAATTLSNQSQGSRVSFGPKSPLRRDYSRGISQWGTGGSKRIAPRTCSVRFELVIEEQPILTLLPPQLRAQCEGWKLAYADFLLRCDLLRVRAELLQHQFLRGDGVPQRAVGGDVPVLASGPRADTRGGSQVCITCAAGSSTCASCSQKPARPLCSFCRLPIKGLSVACWICNHRSHANCLRPHFTTSPTCPACTCRCSENGGLTSATIAVQLPRQSSPSLTRGSAKGTMTPSPGSGNVRVTYSASHSLAPVLENERDGVAGVSESNPEGTSASATAAISAVLSRDREGISQVSASQGLREPGKSQKEGSREGASLSGRDAREGLLARARLRGLAGPEGILGWRAGS